VPRPHRSWTAAALFAAALVTTGLVANSAGAAAPAPGTPAQVAALVAAASSIQSLPSNLTPALSEASNDTPVNEFPALAPCINGSVNAPACVFGDPKGTHTMVDFGDSHAYMWFPALDAIAKAAKWRLVAWMNFGCPFADLTVWDIDTNSPNTFCSAYRTDMIKRINKLHPSLVVISESFYTLNGNNQQITDAQWTSALEKSFGLLKGKSTKKVLIGNSILIKNPIECLTANPSNVQACSVAESNPTYTTQRAAEQAAAKEQKVLYVNEIPWECSSVCTVVIGNMVAYNSAGHLSATYDTYLSDVLQGALKDSMAH
jgi:hypothetical protein